MNLYFDYHIWSKCRFIYSQTRELFWSIFWKRNLSQTGRYFETKYRSKHAKRYLIIGAPQWPVVERFLKKPILLKFMKIRNEVCPKLHHVQFYNRVRNTSAKNAYRSYIHAFLSLEWFRSMIWNIRISMKIAVDKATICLSDNSNMYDKPILIIQIRTHMWINIENMNNMNILREIPRN